VVAVSFAHLLANARPMSTGEAAELAEVVIAGLRVPSPG